LGLLISSVCESSELRISGFSDCLNLYEMLDLFSSLNYVSFDKISSSEYLNLLSSYLHVLSESRTLNSCHCLRLDSILWTRNFKLVTLYFSEITKIDVDDCGTEYVEMNK
jgi:hypothetical protein